MHDPFGRTRLPGDFSREGRVRLIAEFCEAILAGQMPSREACMFVAGGCMAWLENGGDLERDHWRVKAPRASHATPAAVWAKLQAEVGDPHRDERQDDEAPINSGIDSQEDDPT